jgi:flagellar basal-body rod modification protein FlgD
MAISSIAGIGADNNLLSSKDVGGQDRSNLSMNDFFQLLSAQLKNQNMFDPMDNTQYIAQMAQFSTLSQMKELAASFQMSYSVNLIGKQVELSFTDKNGASNSVSGTVEEVAFSGGLPYAKINGEYYDIKSIIKVKNAGEQENTTE